MFYLHFTRVPDGPFVCVHIEVFVRILFQDGSSPLQITSYSFCLFAFFAFETGSPYITHTALNFPSSCLLRSRFAVVHHHAQKVVSGFQDLLSALKVNQQEQRTTLTELSFKLNKMSTNVLLYCEQKGRETLILLEFSIYQIHSLTLLFYGT